ncbi:MAG TPA: indole-3-glycerol phosphate synthase TrpC [Thermomicrobiales bacterium]|nr:indole-3-glycerol phosphate synthase TrpC [Thermomicrobiales bacterium]
MTTSTRGTYLDRILENTLVELDARKRSRSMSALIASAQQQPEPIPFAAALRGTRVTVIAEMKRASPSKGPIAPGAVAAEVAREYIDGGAAAISVLTDETFFGGSLGDLRDVARVARDRRVPVLRKDFVLDEYQIAEARAEGASAVLLIVAALTSDRLRELLACAGEFGVEALIEAHNDVELDRALDAGATTIGVNNRDLRAFTVDLATTERLASRVPPNVTLVGESGIRTRDDVQRLGRVGVHAVLVGEALMRATDRRAALRELLS